MKRSAFLAFLLVVATALPSKAIMGTALINWLEDENTPLATARTGRYALLWAGTTAAGSLLFIKVGMAETVGSIAAGIGYIGAGAAIGGAALLVGLVVLDENTGAPEFKELLFDAHVALHLTEAEVESFNQNRGDINLILNQVNQQVQTEKLSAEEAQVRADTMIVQEVPAQAASAYLKLTTVQ